MARLRRLNLVCCLALVVAAVGPASAAPFQRSGDDQHHPERAPVLTADRIVTLARRDHGPSAGAAGAVQQHLLAKRGYQDLLKIADPADMIMEMGKLIAKGEHVPPEVQLEVLHKGLPHATTTRAREILEEHIARLNIIVRGGNSASTSGRP